MSERPFAFADVESCVESMVGLIGRRIHLGCPLGLGKANHLVNEFFRRAREDPRLELRISTALTLGKPRWRNELERRFLEPLAERLFGGYPELEYLDPLRRGELPDNIRVSEFYFQPGGLTDSPLAQQHYVSSNYTHVVRDLLDAGINVLAQLVGIEEEDGATRYSLSCNSDLTLDLVPRLRERERQGESVAVLAQVNRNLPFMYGEAAVAPDYFDAIVDAPRYEFPLFGPPSRPVSTTDYMIALHVSPLIRDGGTIQIGIGSLGDAITYLLKLRHLENGVYLDLLRAAGVLDRSGALVAEVGGTAPFREGALRGERDAGRRLPRALPERDPQTEGLRRPDRAALAQRGQDRRGGDAGDAAGAHRRRRHLPTTHPARLRSAAARLSNLLPGSINRGV